MTIYGSDGYGEHRYGVGEHNIAHAENEWDNGGISFNQQSTMHSLVKALTSELDRFDADLEQIRASHHINEASGEELEQIAEIVGLNRKDGETDDKYRTRIKAQFRVGTIGTTFDEFAEYAATLLETDIDNIRFSFNLSGEPATASVAADPAVYTESALTRQEASEFLARGVPAGHDVNALEKGSFRLKSDGDADDPTKGLTGDSTSDGGTLAGDVI